MTYKEVSENIIEFGSIFSAINYIKVNLLPKDDNNQKDSFRRLFHKGVVLKQVNSGVLWEIIELREWPGDVRPSNLPPSNMAAQKFVIAKSLSSGYKKAIWPGHYDRFILHDAPKTVKVLFGNGDVQSR